MEIKLSLQHPWKENDRYWTFSIGGGHASLALREDYQKVARQVCHELGFQRLRMHGIFNDDMQVVTTFDQLLKVPSAKRVTTLSFYQIAVVYDALLENGITPFIELGFMPNALASKKKRVFYYKANVSMPKKEEKWCELIEAFVSFLKERYGEAVVETWFFEVWNEPDLRGFFWTGSKEDYFHFYKITIESIRKVLPNAIVGGPATSQNRWLDEFHSYCEKEQVPVSFLSTHHYPGDDIGLPILTLDNLKRLLFSAKWHVHESVHDVFQQMMVRETILPKIRKESMLEQMEKAHEQAGELPLYYTEWNVNPTCTHPIHDTCASAAFIVKHVLDGQYLMKGCSFFTFSDIFEENTFFSEPFSGSFGLTTIHGIPKPSYWAFYLLNQLKGKRLLLPITQEHIEYAVFAGEQELQIILYAQEYVQDERVDTMTIQLPKEVQPTLVQSYAIHYEATNPKALWERMGAPSYLSKQQVEDIKNNSKPLMQELELHRDTQGNSITLEMRTNEVRLLRIFLKEDIYEFTT